MTSGPADLVAADLHKAFGRHPVLAGLDLEVPAGAFAAVLGPSGSGKTTLLRVIAGFERPDRGSVRIGDVILDDDQHHVLPERRHIGYVSQEGSLFPHLSVEANVAFGLARSQRHGSGPRDLLDAVGLNGLERRYPHLLSGGQQQRVALARALAVKPRIVLLDEPFASLDANLRSSVRTDVRAILREAGTTAIMVTHDQDEALSVADLVGVIRRGKVAQVATPQDLYAHPVDAELARFIGEANLIDGRANGDVVDTPFGTLDVRCSLGSGRYELVSVLIRPEQMELHADLNGPGVVGRVVRTGFHGHDVIVQVAPEVNDGQLPIVARVLGQLRLLPGATVRITAHGPVDAWPKRPTGDGHREAAEHAATAPPITSELD